MDSDEPQHLHVAWSWAQGLAPYRETFDNHVPLFHMLIAPVVSCLGERADIIVAMRLLMFPLFAASLWLTYDIGRILFSRRIALWGTVILALFPMFFLRSMEFRADNLWLVLWLATVRILVGGSLTVRRSVAAGILLGAAMSTSLKSIVLAVALALAAAVVLAMSPELRRHFTLARVLVLLAALLAGAVLVPGAVVLVLSSRGVLESAYACTIVHNFEPVGDSSLMGGFKLWRLPVTAIGIAACLLVRGETPPEVGDRRRFLLALTGAIILILGLVMPLVETQTLLVLEPMLALIAASIVINRRPLPVPLRTLVPFAVIELVICILVMRPWQDNLAAETRLIADTLSLTDASDFVLDLKGECVYRRRCWYPVLETFTKRKLANGTLKDDLAEVLAATATYAIGASERFPNRTRAFLEKYFVRVGALRVAGAMLKPRGDDQNAAIPFEILVPGRYAIVAAAGVPQGSLDGTPCDGARFLAAGMHEFRPDSAGQPLAVIWEKAALRGFSPFADTESSR